MSIDGRQALLGKALRLLYHLAVPIVLCIAIGCATPEESYRVLSFFLDDVPLPESMRPPPTPEEVAIGDQGGVSIRPKRPSFEWVTHDPDCDECHASKETPLPYADAPDLCWDCHDEEDFADDVSHGPFAEGACLECHTPHKSEHASLLVHAVPELCTGCHDHTTFPEVEEHQAEQGEDCVECHNPHAGPEEYMLQPAAAAPTARATTTLASTLGTAP